MAPLVFDHKKILAAGVKHIIIVDRAGILSETDTALPPHHAEIAKLTNREHRTGDLATALEGADVFVGVSAPGVLKPEWIQQMNEQPVILQWLTRFLKFFLMKL